jgi:5-methyltetrahydrofolate--homocysteine methyltransferase
MCTPHRRLAQVAECFVHVYSNAGLPNAMGGYDDTPADMARDNHVFAEEGLVNMIGGCCGSTPPHIKVLYITLYCALRIACC